MTRSEPPNVLQPSPHPTSFFIVPDAAAHRFASGRGRALTHQQPLRRNMARISRRDGTQHTMSYSLAAAAAATGLNKTSILRAIKSGKISGTKDALGQWWIERAELHREPKPARTHPRLVQDKIYPGMWRVMGPSGAPSDIVNKTRAKDVACCLTESMVSTRVLAA
jgi:hypothetical protein